MQESRSSSEVLKSKQPSLWHDSLMALLGWQSWAALGHLYEHFAAAARSEVYMSEH